MRVNNNLTDIYKKDIPKQLNIFNYYVMCYDAYRVNPLFSYFTVQDIEELNKKEEDNEFKEIENDYDNISFHHEESETSSRIGGKRNYEQVKKESILNGTPIEETNVPLHKKEFKLI